MTVQSASVLQLRSTCTVPAGWPAPAAGRSIMRGGNWVERGGGASVSVPLPVSVASPAVGCVASGALAGELPLSGPASLELLVNCAGVLHSGERFGKLDPAILEHSLRVNAIGPLLLTEALAPRLADGARVANISSVLGSIASVGRFGTPSYAISKAAQNMATALLARALADRGIVVLGLHPGWAQTEMGGDNATVPVADSVAGLLRVIDAAGPGDSGSFRDWQGQALPW